MQHRTCLSKAGCTHTCTLVRANTHGPALTLNVWHRKIYYHLSVLLSAASFLHLSSPNPEWDQRRGEKHPEPNSPGHCEPVHHHASQPRDQTTAERWGERKHPLFTFTFSFSAMLRLRQKCVKIIQQKLIFQQDNRITCKICAPMCAPFLQNCNP